MKKNLYIPERYQDPYGTWNVTTEGDVEGKTVTNLGNFTGYVDEIALHLADKCYYSLKFTKTKPVSEYTPKRTSVNIAFDIESNTWDLDAIDRIELFRQIFKNRPVNVKDGQYYASVVIDVVESEKKEILKKQALEKLSPEEKEALGINQ